MHAYGLVEKSLVFSSKLLWIFVTSLSEGQLCKRNRFKLYKKSGKEGCFRYNFDGRIAYVIMVGVDVCYAENERIRWNVVKWNNIKVGFPLKRLYFSINKIMAQS